MKSIHLFAFLGVLFPVAVAAAGCSAGDDETNPPTADGEDEEIKAQCGGLLPHTCEVCSDGKTACAHHVIKDRKCAIEICAPAPSNACTKASDCHGALPRLAMQCADGTTAGAHFACEEKACVIRTCDQVSAGECTKASDCHELLPHLAQKCDDGTTASAHFECTSAKKCAVAICP